MDRLKLNQLVGQVTQELKSTGYECIEAEWEGKEKTLRIYIDRPEGVHFEDCAKVTETLRTLSLLDDMVHGTYNLEVSSPGIERPLRRKNHFEKHVGDTVRVQLLTKVLDRRQGVGKVIEVSGDDFITLETTNGLWKFPLETIDKAKLVYDWGSE